MKPKNPAPRRYDNVILVLQGGGALGAYQAGVFEGMTEAGYTPNWVTGVSIGAINAALIAGNAPGMAVSPPTRPPANPTDARVATPPSFPSSAAGRHMSM